jgi:hypothetical protein
VENRLTRGRDCRAVLCAGYLRRHDAIVAFPMVAGPNNQEAVTAVAKPTPATRYLVPALLVISAFCVGIVSSNSSVILCRARSPSLGRSHQEQASQVSPSRLAPIRAWRLEHGRNTRGSSCLPPLLLNRPAVFYFFCVVFFYLKFPSAKLVYLIRHDHGRP